MTDKFFADSDSIRNAKPLPFLKTVVLNGPLHLESGGVLPEVKVAYETYGQLSAAKDNAILVCHALSGDSHVARHDQSDDPGWWDLMVGPGKPMDTDRFFVICSNLLGGCRGTTGPGCINPATGKPYGRDFPTITLVDMVEVQRRLIDFLEIRELLAVAGGSLGGQQVLTWAAKFPERVHGALPIATSPRLNSQAIAFDVVARNAIRQDPGYHHGQYYAAPRGPETGLAIARMIGHITYLSQEAMTRKFDVDRLCASNVSTEFEKIFSVGSYLGHQGDKFVDRFDANSYIAITMAMDLFDMGSTTEELAAALRPAACRWLILSFSTDWLFSPAQSRNIVDALLANNAAVSYCNVQSACGHDAFLLSNDFASYGEMIRAFIDNLALKTTPENKEDEVAEAHGPNSIFRPDRLDYDRIAELIPSGASVLDLGCGSGRLLARLRQENSRHLRGVELDEQRILAGIRRGLDVIHADLNAGLSGFTHKQFDYVVLSQTLQAVNDVELLVNEMLRVGRTCIVSFPNFAYHKLRRMLAEEGRSPKAEGVLCYEWYNTPNRRFFSMADFDAFCQEMNIRVHRRIGLDTESGVEVIDTPNLNADLAFYVISRNGHSGEALAQEEFFSKD